MSQNNPEPAYETIKIFKKTYRLPVMGGESFTALQGNIQQRQEIIKTGKRQENVLYWIQEPQEVTFGQRFSELKFLVKDYNQLIDFLTHHREAYQTFFIELTEELKEVVRNKLKKVSQEEQKRYQLEQRLTKKKTNSALLNTIKQLKSQSYETLMTFGNAFLLMLKKVEILNKGINKLIEDQDSQKKILDQMIEDLSDYREVYELKLEMDETRRQALELAQVAVDLENIINPVLGQFQGLINQIVSIDGELNETVSQVQELVRNLTQQKAIFSFEGQNQISDQLLDFLVLNEQKKNILNDALDGSKSKTTKFLLNNYQLLDQCVEIDVAIENIQAKVEQQLTKMSDKYRQTIDIQSKPSDFTPDSTPLNQVPANLIKEDLGKGVELEMVYIPAGEFIMGTSDEEIDRLCEKDISSWYKNEAPQHKVKLQEFYLGKYPVTQAQYQAVMGKHRSEFQGENNPVERVTWDMAQEFCQKLSAQTGKNYQLPSEAQWEYACRAGTTTRYYFGDDANQLGEYAWYLNNSNNQTHPVGQKQPNAWELYDMHGNVWEWCQDDYVDNYQNTPRDGTSYRNSSMKYITLRGGSYDLNTINCRSTYRNSKTNDSQHNNNGFRIMLVVSSLV